MVTRNARYQWVDVFSALASEPRLRIVERLMRGSVHCQEILKDLGLSQPAVSYHLGKLERSGILLKEKNGTRNCYRISDQLEDVLRPCLKEDGSWNTM